MENENLKDSVQFEGIDLDFQGTDFENIEEVEK